MKFYNFISYDPEDAPKNHFLAHTLKRRWFVQVKQWGLEERWIVHILT